MDEFNEEDIGKLLRLKRFEQPPPAYFDNFLHEFHRRQRDELLRQPLWKIAVERAQDFMFNLSPASLASYPVAMAAVLVFAAVVSFDVLREPPAGNLATVQTALVSPTASADKWSLGKPLTARVYASQPVRTFDQRQTHSAAVPPRYVLDSMPVSYEQTTRF